jgi:hypothetical protein
VNRVLSVHHSLTSINNFPTYYPSSGSSDSGPSLPSLATDPGIIAGSVVGGVVFIASIVATICFWGRLFQYLKRRNRQAELVQYNPQPDQGMAQWQQQQWQPMAYQPPPQNSEFGCWDQLNQIINVNSLQGPILYQPPPQPIAAMPTPQHFSSLAPPSPPAIVQSDGAPTQQGDQELSAALALIASRAQQNDQDRAAILSSLQGVNSLHPSGVTPTPSAMTSSPTHVEPSSSSSRSIPLEKEPQQPDEQVSPPPYQETGISEVASTPVWP